MAFCIRIYVCGLEHDSAIEQRAHANAAKDAARCLVSTDDNHNAKVLVHARDAMSNMRPRSQSTRRIMRLLMRFLFV